MISSDQTLTHRNLTLSSCSALIDHCLSLDSLSPAASVHARLIKLGLHRHTFLSNCLLGLYSHLGAVGSALRVFLGIPSKNTFTWNILLAVFCKAGRMEAARRLFDEMPERDPVSWNSMISGYVLNGLVKEAFGALHQMLELGVRPSGFTYSITASVVSSDRKAKQLHGNMIRNELNFSSTVLGNSLISMYGRAGLMDYACCVFQRMEEPDIVSWNSVISAWGNAGDGDRSLEWFHLMMVSGLSPDEFTTSTVINVCADVEDLAKGEQLLARCFTMGYLSNSIVSSAVIDMYSKCGRLDDSIRLFQEMTRWDSALCNSMVSGYARNGIMHEALKLFMAALRKGIRPTGFTFASILSSSSCFGLTEQGTQIHCWILKSGLEADMIVTSALVDMYSKLGLMEPAMRIFSAMLAKDLICWNTMIIGLSQNGQGIEALRIFGEMQEAGIQPDRITLVGVLSACSHEGMICEGKRIFSSMENKYGFTCGLEHYACMVDMLGRAGRLREAMKILETMPHQPNASVWGLLLDACTIHGDLKFAEVVAEKVMELEPRSALPYLVLARTYGGRGRWESMARVLRIMKERCAKKVSGCSWICMKDRISVFRSDQLLHCGGEAMYSMLRMLVWEMESEGYVPEQHAEFEDG